MSMMSVKDSSEHQKEKIGLDSKLLLTIPEVCERISLGRSKVYELIAVICQELWTT